MGHDLTQIYLYRQTKEQMIHISLHKYIGNITKNPHRFHDSGGGYRVAEEQGFSGAFIEHLCVFLNSNKLYLFSIQNLKIRKTNTKQRGKEAFL